jgi:hypothetical protein
MTWTRKLKKPLAVGAVCFILAGQYALAQNLGGSPQFNVAVQRQTGAQPEGAFLNSIIWIGNVIAPVGAGGAVLGAIVAGVTGRGYARWLLTAGALPAVCCDPPDRILDHQTEQEVSAFGTAAILLLDTRLAPCRQRMNQGATGNSEPEQLG